MTVPVQPMRPLTFYFLISYVMKSLHHMQMLPRSFLRPSYQERWRCLKQEIQGCPSSGRGLPGHRDGKVTTSVSFGASLDPRAEESPAHTNQPCESQPGALSISQATDPLWYNESAVPTALHGQVPSSEALGMRDRRKRRAKSQGLASFKQPSVPER